jgi:fatty acid desaturase
MSTTTDHARADQRRRTTTPPTEYAHLSPEQVEELGRELDAIRQRILDERGEEDAAYIRRIVKLQRRLELSGRGLLFLSFLPPAWLAGVAALGFAKIVDNMEIGHNVMHGQYDWMGDPTLSSQQFEWDTAAPSANWKRSHNVEHHTWTNVIGKDRDIGYGILRMSEEQRWRPEDLTNPVKALGLALFFQWGVALHDLEIDRIRSGDKRWEDVADVARLIRRKSAQQAKKDYLLFPLLAFPIAPLVLAGNVAANLVRNVWAFSIIFCGHFPDGVALFTEEDVDGETRGEWYLRQMLGSANITGGKAFHTLSGNLSHQIEHHLFPDLPARRYADIAVEVRELCERYGLRYNTGRFSRQLFTVARRIVRLGLPDRLRRRPDRPTEAPVPAPAHARLAA